MSPTIDDEDEVEEGQLVTSPGRAVPAEEPSSGSPAPTAGSQMPAASDSPAKSRNRFRSRSRSHSRRRTSGSRSKRRRSSSRSRSPYAGPVIRDMRRGGGRNRQNRFSRGRRPFRSRNKSHSLSASRTPSPRHVSRKSVSPSEQKRSEHNSRNGRRGASAEKAAAPVTESTVRQLRPEDIKNQAKADTMSFLAMLHEKKQVNKMIPINLKTKSSAGKDAADGSGHAKSHGFVSTFASLAGRAPDAASGDEDDGWEVVDDARSSNSPNKRLPDKPQAAVSAVEESAATVDKTVDESHVKLKGKKKKKSSRKEEGKKKKRSKEKKRKQSVSESSDESDSGDHKKRRKRKRSASPSLVSKSASKVCKSSHSEISAPKDPEDKKSKKERKKKSKHSRRSDSVSESERVSRKKGKKKKAKKSSQKKRKRKSSSESSASDSGSEAMEIPDKRKKVKDEKEEPVASVRRSPDAKTSPTNFQFPRSVLMYTQTQPSIQYCRSPRTILLNPADDCPRILSSDPPIRSPDARPAPENVITDRETEKTNLHKKKASEHRSSSTTDRRDKSPVVRQKSFSDSKKDEDDDHNRGQEKSTAGRKSNLSSKLKRDERISDSSEKRNKQEEKGSPQPEDKSSVMDSVKQELLQKVAQKRKENGKPEGKDVKILNDKIVIGKMKQVKKPGRRDDKSTPLDMNQDYCWYQQHYATSYAMDPYAAAYYAQYAMVTSGDYTNPDITAWLQGYGFSYDPNNTASMPLLPPSDVEAAPIPVLAKDVPDAAVEQFYQPSDVSNMAEEMDVESDDECPSPPAPPPPPPPPHITTLLVDQPLVLPNGQEVPAGTKQVIVHPYPESHLLSSHFTPEFVQSSLNSLQSSKCEDKAGRVVANCSGNSASVVT